MLANSSHRRRLVGLTGGAALLLTAGAAHSLDFQFGEFDISLETALSAGIAVRAEDANRSLIGKVNNVDANFATNDMRGSYSVNGDDGNLEFQDSGDVFFSQLKASSDLTVQWGEWGVFARGNYRFDPHLEDNDFFPDEDFGPGRSRSEDFKDMKNDAVQDAIANDAELFDLYLFGSFNFWDRNISIKAGRHVLNWGESTFIQNGINSIIPIDARQARGPGAEVREIFRPFGMISGSMELIDDISLEAFYQYDWERTIPDPAGTYFSTSDFVGAGGTDAMIGFGRCNENTPPVTAGGTCLPGMGEAPGGTTIPRIGDDRPEDGGQYGARLGFYLDWFYSTGLSLYAINYHSRLPLASGRTADEFVVLGGTPVPITGSGALFLEYPEDIKLYGVSFNTFSNFLNVAIQGEFSVKQDQPLQIDDVELLLYALGVDNSELNPALPPGTQFSRYAEETGTPFVPGREFKGYIRRDVYQWDITFTRILGPNWTGANQTVLLAEFAGMHVSGMPDKAALPLDGPATFVPNQQAAATFVTNTPVQDRSGYADASSWGYRLAAAFTYNNVMERFNLTPSLTFFHDVNGNSPGPISNHLEGRKQATLGLTATYLDAWEAGISYTAFWGGQNTNAGPDLEIGERGGGITNNLLEDRDFLNMFVRYTF